MLRQSVRLSRSAMALLCAALVMGCSNALVPTAAVPPAGQSVQATTPAASPADSGDAASIAPAAVLFTGSSDFVVSDLTDAGLVCGDTRPFKAFKVRGCSKTVSGTRLAVSVYWRADASVAGEDITIVGAAPTDPDTLLEFLAIDLGGAMGPDAFNAVTDAVTARLDGSSPEPAWISPDLQLTVKVTPSTAAVTLLAPDLVAVWGN